MITVSGLAKAYGDRTLFADVDLHLRSGCRYGLVGANGSGKSTFLRILAGEERASAGTVTVPNRARVGTLDQDRFVHDATAILDVVVSGHEELWEAMRAKEEVLAEADEGFDADRFAAAEETIQRLDGYAMEARAAEILEGLGIPAGVHDRPLATLSGGFKLRALLARALAADPDALLLDEPTNHLDIVSIRWLESFLSGYDGCLVVTSHDHRFLDRVSSHVLDVDYETITLYPGNYSAFEEAKRAERERREAEIAKREAEIADHMAFVERFRAKASKARQAQSKLKRIERIEIEPLPKSSRRYPTFRFEQRRRSGKVALEVRGISKSFGENRVLADVSLKVRRGDRVAVIGPNGIGKSTLLKIATGRLEPDAGEVEWGYEAHPGYVAQDHEEEIGGKESAEEWLWRACPGKGRGFVRSRLGLVLLSGEEALKPLDALSGGEAARLALARLGVERPNVLVLDEPTNHLDIEGVEALVEGLEAFDGTILFVSHDRWFVERLATRIVELAPDGVRDFDGDFRSYVAWRGEERLDAGDGRIAVRREDAVEGRSERGRRGGRGRGGDAERREARELRRRLGELLERRDRLVEELEAAEGRLEALRERFAEPGLYEAASREEIRELQREESEAAGRVEALVGEWEELERTLEALDVDGPASR